jgi:hypothetical protein
MIKLQVQEAAVPVVNCSSDSDTPLSLRTSRKKKAARKAKGPVEAVREPVDSDSDSDSDTPLRLRYSRRNAPPSKKAKKWGVADVVAAAQKAVGRMTKGPAKAPHVPRQV